MDQQNHQNQQQQPQPLHYPGVISVPQFITEPFTPQNVFLPNKEYSLALDTLTKACSDVLCVSVDGTKILLGKRKVEPQPDWWMVGGRGRPGETTREAARRNLLREVGVEVEVGRFEVVGSYSLVWGMREQEPKENGTADVSTVHVVRLREGEEEKVKGEEGEYEEMGFVGVEEVLEGEFHPCLKQVVRDWKKNQAMEELLKFVGGYEKGGEGEGEGEGEGVVRAAVRFARAKREADLLGEVTRVCFVNGKYVNM